MNMLIDCINTQSFQGRNATPLALIDVVHEVFGGKRSPFEAGIDLDPASDRVINDEVMAKQFYGLEVDSFSIDWCAENVWMNPPGTSVKGGTYQERLTWLLKKKAPRNATIKAAQWYERLYYFWDDCQIQNAIALVYRAGSLGSVGYEFLSDAEMCFTVKGAASPAVSGSGRLSFETINERDEREPQTSNTQSSVILGLFRDEEMRQRFREKMQVFGVVK